MSRLGKQPIAIPEKVDVAFAGGVLTVKGPGGELTRTLKNDIKVTVEDGTITLTPQKGSIETSALWGTYAAHVHNMIEGVTDGFEKKLEIEGVGYRAEMQGNKVVLSVGFSHPIEHEIPEGITASIEKNVITIRGADKEAVGQFAANIRASKKPEPYKGKGVRYHDEYVIRKQGKRAVT